MKTNRFLFRTAFIAGLGLIVSSSTLFFGNGAPSARTGSIGDNGGLCTDCHNNPPTISDQSLTIEVLDMDSTIIAGQNYEIKITANGPSHTKIGFESTIELNSNHSKIGSFAVVGSNMQIKDNFYATHIGSGTSAPDGSISWSYQWTAPTSSLGDATIYTAALFSNNNGGTTGDITVTESLDITISENLDLTELTNELNLSVYPNPAIEEVHVNFNLNEDAAVKIQIIDLAGKYTQVIANEMMTSGEHSISSNLDLPSGTYLVSIQKGTERLIEKLIIQ